jgi:hypothetical protein
LEEAAMRVATEPTTIRRDGAAAAALLRAACLALVVGLTGCGGGGDTATAPDLASAPAPDPDTTEPAPATLLDATALSIDGGASGNATSLRIVRSANGDGFAVWQADDGTRHDLWANRYQAATAAWGSAIRIEASSADIDDFDLSVDASGNAVVVWHEATGDPRICCGVVMGARFDAGAGAWAAPVLLSSDGSQPRVASDAGGAVLAVYVAAGGHLVRGRFYDMASGSWQPEAVIEQNNTGTGFSYGPTAWLDGGNALAAWGNGRTGASLVAGNYFLRSTGDWVFQLPPDTSDLMGAVPGSFSAMGSSGNVQLAATAGGDFLVAWTFAPFDDPENGAEIRIARFSAGSHAWSEAQTIVPSSGQTIQLQRIGSDGAGNTLMLWTENAGTRTALKALRVFEASCSAIEVIDRAVGGGAARADLGVDALGHAIAIWQQFEGGRADDGSRSNIAINRFDGAAGAWAGAVLAEAQPGNALSPRVSAAAGQALLGWIQAEGSVNRVKALLQPLAEASVGQ